MLHPLVPRNLAYVPCEPPNNPFTPAEYELFASQLLAAAPDVDRRMEYQKLRWICGLQLMVAILEARGQPRTP